MSAISKIVSNDESSTHPRYAVWKYAAPLPPDSLMWSVGGHNLEQFLVVGEAWAQVVSRYATPDCRLLDIGCGCGRIARFLLNNLFISYYIGFDVIEANINWCSRYLRPAFRNRQCDFYHFDIYSKEYNPEGVIKAKEFVFPCEDASVDLAFAASLFTHLLECDADRYLSEAARVLRDGGIAVFSIHVAVPPGVNYQGNETRIDINKTYFEQMASRHDLQSIDCIDDLAGQTVLILQRSTRS
jgi:SAM-dependent methyltransferase